MNTCSVFVNYAGWWTHQLEKADPDLCGTAKPANMSDHEWRAFQRARADRQPSSSSNHDGDPAFKDEDQDDGEAIFHNLVATIDSWEYNFARHLQILLDALNHYAATETVVLLSLCARLSTTNHGTKFEGLRQGGDGGA